MPTAITVISARFAEDLSSGADNSVTPPDAIQQIAGSETTWAETGLPSRGRRVRSWLTFWPGESLARAHVDNVQAAIPLLGTAESITTAVLLPYSTHGDVNWFGKPGEIPLDSNPRPEKGAPVFVITSLGLGSIGPGAVAFGQGNHAIRKTIRSQPGLRFEAQILADNPVTDGVTMTLWDNEASVIDFAYRQDPHRTAMKVKEHKDISRGSFTRSAVRHFSGSWDGIQTEIG